MEPIRFGFYLLVRKIASGERAELFEAKRLGPARERNLVVKRFRAKVPKQSDLVHNFIRRARLARNLQHPNIARLHDFGEVEGSYFTATEYVIGVDFSHLLRRQVEHSDKLMAQLSVYIVQEVLATLTYAHGWVDVEGEHTPILHQGIKPSNVLVTMDGKIKVTDYGLSRVFLDAPSLGSANLPKGDSFFVSPEQLKGGVIDRRSDLFSLGALLLYLLSQRFITETTTREEFLDLLLLEDFFEALNFREDKAQLLRDTVIRSLRVNRNERFQTATEFLKALEPIVPAEVHPQLAAQLSTHVQRVLGIRSHETETLLWDEELLTEPEGMSETAPGPSPKRWTARWRAPMAFIGIILVTAGYLAARRLSRSENVSGRQNAKMDLKVEKRRPPAPTPVTEVVDDEQTAETLKPAASKPKAVKENPPKSKNVAKKKVKAISAKGVGYLTIIPDGPFASVTVDGKKIGDTPMIRYEIREGTHKLIFENEKLSRRHETKIVLRKGEELQLTNIWAEPNNANDN